MLCRISTLLSTTCLLSTLISGAHAASTWKYGDSIPVTCLNRTIETGEHITDSHGNLQYIPFYTCTETSAPLSLHYGISSTQNCTIALTDPLYHLLEFYIHNDAPLTCRIPSAPPAAGAHIAGKAGSGEEGDGYTPLVVALSGTLQLSHLHVRGELNLVVHTSGADEDVSKSAAKKSKEAGLITAAAAYSISPSSRNSDTKLIIGDDLTLTFHTRWYTGSYLPLTNELQKHGFWSTLSYCLFAAGASAAICIAYFRGVDLPRRLRFHGIERLGGRRGEGLPKYNGYGFTGNGMNGSGLGVGTAANGNGNGYGGYGFVATGKRD